MLQLQNVTKTYKTKAGTVNALDGVSITFPSSGLVFITGKSGCGKTTLLNVIGGLDGIDGGEILIQDKKFSTFSPTEYDSYRNTFIGFIFQEYNLLPEFTVEQNIKIAMELQGRKADEAEFEKLLQDVEIAELKSRTPAELSGGQRQRVAIARALVKEPRIIMADEPTGALDSGTGIQVLDTLKKLSKDKLVIVVSHDREFAEKYADRIIQLVDGKVAQDITFKETAIEKNVSEQENTLVVRDGADLSENEKDLLAKAVKERKKIEIVEHLSYRDKEPTGEIEHTVDKPVSLKKSKMKLKSAAFLGVKSLAVKPFRLVLTILISSLAFAVFALFDTIANFNTTNVLKNTLISSLSQTAMTKTSYTENFEAGDQYPLKVSDKVISDLEKETKGAVKGVFTLRDDSDGYVAQSLPLSDLDSSDMIIGTNYYTKSVNGFIEFDAKEEIQADGKTFKDFPYRLIAGKYPVMAYENNVANEKKLHEIAISTYLADSIVYYLNGEPLNGKTIKRRNDLLDATLIVDLIEYKIVGLIDCGKIPEKYDILKESAPDSITITAALLNDYSAYMSAGAQNCLFVAKGFKDGWEALNQSANSYYIGNTAWTFNTEGSSAVRRPISYVYNAKDYDEKNVILFKEKESGDVSLGSDEILIHHINLVNLFSVEIASLPTLEERDYARELILSMAKKDATENKEVLKELLKLIKKDLSSGSISITLRQRFNKTDVKTSTNLKIVGIYCGVADSYSQSARYRFMMNEDLMTRLKIYSQQGDYGKLLFSPASLRSGVDAVVNHLVSEEGLTLQLYNNSALSLIRENELTIKQVANLFLYAAVALALLSIFLLYNYISTSISSKKRSVGVLRGLGAGGKDILLTFLSESLIIAIVNGILANVFAYFGCSFVNSYIVETINISIHFALFGARQIVIVATISLITAILSSALPIIKISKKKPVDLIRRP